MTSISVLQHEAKHSVEDIFSLVCTTLVYQTTVKNIPFPDGWNKKEKSFIWIAAAKLCS